LIGSYSIWINPAFRQLGRFASLANYGKESFSSEDYVKIVCKEDIK
jgi:hypothetical protein